MITDSSKLNFKNNIHTLTVFILIYVISKLYDEAASFRVINYHQNSKYLLDYFFIFTSVIALVKPSSVIRFSVFILVVTIKFIIDLPAGSNHEFVSFFINLCILACFIYTLLSEGINFSNNHFSRQLLPLVRICTIIMYFWVVVNKLNLDYLNPVYSCANSKAFQLNQIFTIFPQSDWFLRINPALSLVLEAGIPVLLLISRARLFGIALSIIFHFIIGFIHFRFTILIYALLAVFIPEQCYESLFNFVKLKVKKLKYITLKIDIFKSYNYLKIPIKLVFLLFTIKLISIIFSGHIWIINRFNIYILISALLFTVLIFLIFIFGCMNKELNTNYLPSRKYLLLFPALFFIYCTFPYIGLKNNQVLAMYSNLKTEGHKTNHYFIPSSVQIFDKLDNLVEIQSSSLIGLDKLSKNAGMRPMHQTLVMYPKNYIKFMKEKNIEISNTYKFKVPLMEIQNIITTYTEKGMKDIKLSYRLDGRIIDIENAEDDKFLSGAPLLQRKFLALKAVPESDHGLCMW